MSRVNPFRFAWEVLNRAPLRNFEHRELKRLPLSGRVLDLGGAKHASYRHLLNGDFTYVPANLFEQGAPDVVFDFTRPFPLKEQSFDNIVSFNTFEHLHDFETAFREAARVLKRNGTFCFATPFLCHIHGSPGDYWRYSESALRNLLTKNGLLVQRITPLGTGIFLAQYALIHDALPRIVRPPWAFFAIVLDRMFGVLEKYRTYCSEKTYPLGYFVIAKKEG